MIELTDEELKMLRAIFSGARAIIESMRESNDDVYNVNTLFNLESKLGIYYLLDED